MEEQLDIDCPLILQDNENNIDSTRIKFSMWKMVKPHLVHLFLTILVDVILPIVIYLILYHHVKPVYALLAAGIPPFLMIIAKASFARTFDALGFIVLIAFVATAAAALLTHNPTIILLEKSLVTGLISLIFAVTLIPFNRCHIFIKPLAFYFYRDLVPTDRSQIGLPDCLFDDDELLIDDDRPILSSKQKVAQVYEWIFAHCSSFRYNCYFLTSLWSIGLFCEFLARFILILIHLSVEKIFIYGHIILTSMTIILIITTIFSISRERKQTLITIEQWKRKYSTELYVNRSN